jgi:hypothetical protein
MAWTIALSDADISTLTTAYTMAAGSEGRMSASFTNRATNATATVQLWVVPSGETRGNEHLKESGTTLGLAGTPQANLERFFVVPAGAVVFVQASTANVSCQVQGDVTAVSPSSTSIEDGTISMSGNWTNYLGASKLRRTLSSQITINLFAFGSGVVTSAVATLPAGYRPITEIVGVSGAMYDSSLGQSIPAIFNISSSGVITGSGTDGASAVPFAVSDIVYLNITFFNA